MGCWDSLYLKPWTGSMSFGAVMFTPGIGPATDGLNGLELFCASHPATASIKAAESAAAAVVYFVVMKSLGLVSGPVCSGRQPRADTLSAGDTLRFIEAGVLGIWSTSRIDAHLMRVKVRPADVGFFSVSCTDQPGRGRVGSL